MAEIKSIQGERLKLFLKHVGLRQIDLAREVDVPKQNVWQMINVTRTIPLDVLNHLIKKHRLNPEWWHTGKGKYTTGADARTSIATDVALLNQKIDSMYKTMEFYKRENHKLHDEIALIKKHLGL